MFIVLDKKASYRDQIARPRVHAVLDGVCLDTVRPVPGEEHGGDNNANNDADNDDDDDRALVGLPRAAPEGTPLSHFPNDVARRRTPPAPVAPLLGVSPRPVAVVQVSSRPVTLTVVDRSMAAAAALAATTAATADGATMDDGTDITARLQSGADSRGAKPKKTRHARKYQVTVVLCTYDRGFLRKLFTIKKLRHYS